MIKVHITKLEMAAYLLALRTRTATVESSSTFRKMSLKAATAE
jgi:hypothetical protein